MQFDAVIFDFDYTLADSSDAIVACANHALTSMGYPEAPPDEIRRIIGLSLTQTFLSLAGSNAEARAPEFVKLFTQKGDEIMVAWTKLFEPTRDTVTALRALGLKTGIVSTKYRYRIEAVLRRDELLDAFDTIVGGEDVADHKPHPGGLLRAIEQLACPADRTLYVGDSTVDAETAQRAGTAFAAVLTGTTPRDAFSAYPAVAVLEHVGDLPAWLSR